MGSSHFPCRIVGVFSGRYQPYCSKGVLITSFCATELTPLASGFSISLENWQQAPKVLLMTQLCLNAANVISPCALVAS